MTPETTTTVAYLLWFVLGGIPQGTPLAITSVPGLASMEECQYLAGQLLVGIENPKYRCLAYQTVVAASAPKLATKEEYPQEYLRDRITERDTQLTNMGNCDGMSCRRLIPGDDNNKQSLAVTRPLKGDAVTPPSAVLAEANADPEGCEQGASSCPVEWKPDPNDEPCASGGKGCILPDTWEHLPNHVRIPRTKIEHEFGTAFGVMPRDRMAAPLNELGIAFRSTIFRLFVWPGYLRHS